MANMMDAMDRNFTSPNVEDVNGESANVVDALAMIARAIVRHAEAIEEASNNFPAYHDDVEGMKYAIGAISTALEDVAQAIRATKERDD